MSNSRIRAWACSSPRFATRYRNPNAQCAYFAFNMVRMMSGMLAANYVTANARSNARITPTTWKPAWACELFLVERCESELLSTHAGFKHQTILGHRKHDHSLLVLRIGRGALGGDNGTGGRTHGPFAALEIIQRGFVLEEDHFSERLAAQLRAD